MDLSPSGRYRADSDWSFHFFPGEGGVVYHRFTGELHALDELAAWVFSRLIDQPDELSRLIDETRAAFPEALLTAEEVIETVNTLCRAGMVQLCQSENDSLT